MTAMQPADDGFAERVRVSFARQPFMRAVGAAIETVEPGRVVLTLAHRDELTQQHGFVHGGVLAAALDTACGYAAFSLMPAGAAVLTVEFKVNFLAPARGPRLRFEGVVAKPGRTLSVVDGRATQVDDGKLVATMTATMMAMPGREGLRD